MLDEKKNEDYWYLLHTRVFEGLLAECFNLYRNAGIEPILIKGWSVARFYTGEKQRVYTDIDLCVEPQFYEKALVLMQSEAGSHLNIDLHNGFKTLDTLPWEDLYDNSLLINREGAVIRVLRPEDQLRLVCIHWLTDGGANREKLWDVFYLVKNRPGDFDWERCLEVVSPRRRLWIICAIGLAHKYLGLDLEGLPFASEAQKLPKWLTRAVEKEWKSGVPLIPLRNCRSDLRLFIQQVLKRIPPNPIQATIDLDGEFDEKPRFFYQIKDVFFRLRR